jgi:hypothetical protein
MWNKLIVDHLFPAEQNASIIHHKKALEMTICSLAHPLPNADKPASIINIKFGDTAIITLITFNTVGQNTIVKDFLQVISNLLVRIK